MSLDQPFRPFAFLALGMALSGCFLFEGEESTDTEPRPAPGAPLCQSGESQACVCFGDVTGTQTCDGDDWGACTGCSSVPTEWSCQADYYADGAYCDCECGAFDPDCSLDLPVYCFGDGVDPTPQAPEGTVCGASAMCIAPEQGASSVTFELGADLTGQPWLPESRIYLYDREPEWFRGVRPADAPAPIAGAWLSEGSASFDGLAPGQYWFDVKFIRETGSYNYLKGAVAVSGDHTTRVLTIDSDWITDESSWRHQIWDYGARLGYVTVWTDSPDITTTTGGPVNGKLGIKFGEPGNVSNASHYISASFTEPRCGEDFGDYVHTYVVPEGTYSMEGIKPLEWLEWGPYSFEVTAETCVLVRIRNHDRYDNPLAPPAIANPAGGNSTVTTFDNISGQELD